MEFHFDTDKFLKLCRKLGHRVWVAGYDEYSEQIKQLLREHFFLINPNLQEDCYVDVCVIPRADNYYAQYTNQAPSWATSLALFNADCEPGIMFRRVEEQWHLAGGEFVRRSPKMAYTPMNDSQQFLKYTLDAWPDLAEFAQDIYVVYAGGASGYNICERTQSELLDEIRKAFTRGYTKIIFWCGEETLQPISLYKCQRAAEAFKDYAPPYTFFYVSGCQDAEKLYTDLCKQHDFKNPMVMMSYFRFEAQAKQSFLESKELQQVLDNTPFNTKPDRSTKYVNFNRVPRTHRVALWCELFKRDVIDDSYTSFDISELSLNPEDDFLGVDGCRVYNSKYVSECKDILMNNMWRFPQVLNRTADRDNPVDLKLDDLQYFKNSYFSLVTETVFYRSDGNTNQFDGVFFSEKIYKPLVFKHPFILCAVPKSLDRLRSIGYKTFHPHINELYDDVADDDTRLRIVADEVARLCSLTDAEWSVLLEKIAPIVEHNYEWFKRTKDITLTKEIWRYFK